MLIEQLRGHAVLTRPTSPSSSRPSRKGFGRRASDGQVAETLLNIARQPHAEGLAKVLQSFFFDHIDSLAAVTASLASTSGTKPGEITTEFLSYLADDRAGAEDSREDKLTQLWQATCSAGHFAPRPKEPRPKEPRPEEPRLFGPLRLPGEGWLCWLVSPEGAGIAITWRDNSPENLPHPKSQAIAQVCEAIQLRLADLAKLRQLGHLAFIDPLTGLGNSRQLGRFVTDQIHRANRFGGGFTLLFVDLDKFKAINDSYGHDEGDRILIRVARVLEGAVRSVDQVFRLGGDEFVVVLAGAGAATSAAVVARIRAMLQADKAPQGGAPTPKCSVGIASFPGDGHTYNELLKVADQGMYTDKKSGKTTVKSLTAPAIAGVQPKGQR